MAINRHDSKPNGKMHLPLLVCYNSYEMSPSNKVGSTIIVKRKISIIILNIKVKTGVLLSSLGSSLMNIRYILFHAITSLLVKTKSL